MHLGKNVFERESENIRLDLRENQGFLWEIFLHLDSE